MRNLRALFPLHLERRRKITGKRTVPATTLPGLSRSRIVAWLARGSFHHFVDSEGDVGGLWSYRTFYFLCVGPQREILQVRGYWNRELSIEHVVAAHELCNEWNSERIWPKAYVRVRDTGKVTFCVETSNDLEHGASDSQLDQLLSCGLTTGNYFFDVADGRFPDRWATT